MQRRYARLPFRVPYVPTPEHVVRRMLELANVGPDDVVFDLGCGDGRILIIAAKEFGVKKAIGIEIRPDLVEKARKRVAEEGLEGRVKIYEGDFMDFDISEATVVTLYLLTSANMVLRPKLEAELRPGARIVSHEFEIPGWRPKSVAIVDDGYIRHRIYLYIR